MIYVPYQQAPALWMDIGVRTAGDPLRVAPAVTAGDPATFVAIPLALIAAAALAIYVPARRAMLIDPIVALRYE